MEEQIVSRVYQHFRFALANSRNSPYTLVETLAGIPEELWKLIVRYLLAPLKECPAGYSSSIKLNRNSLAISYFPWDPEHTRNDLPKNIEEEKALEKKLQKFKSKRKGSI